MVAFLGQLLAVHEDAAAFPAVAPTARHRKAKQAIVFFMAAILVCVKIQKIHNKFPCRTVFAIRLRRKGITFVLKMKTILRILTLFIGVASWVASFLISW